MTVGEIIEKLKEFDKDGKLTHEEIYCVAEIYKDSNGNASILLGMRD